MNRIGCTYWGPIYGTNGTGQLFTKNFYFNIRASVLQRDTLAPYLYIICLDNVLRTSIDIMKENGSELEKERNRRYTAQIIMDADYADDIALKANSPAQTKSLQHRLERAACGIGFHVNAEKKPPEYMSSNQRGNISTLKGGSLKLVHKFTYLGSSVSSTDNYISAQLAKAYTAIDRLLVIWKSELTDKIKRSFFPSSDRVDTAIWKHSMDTN